MVDLDIKAVTLAVIILNNLMDSLSSLMVTGVLPIVPWEVGCNATFWNKTILSKLFLRKDMASVFLYLLICLVISVESGFFDKSFLFRSVFNGTY